MTFSVMTSKGFFSGLFLLFFGLTLPIINVIGQNTTKGLTVNSVKPDSIVSVDSIDNVISAANERVAKDTSLVSDSTLKNDSQFITDIVDYEAQDSLVFLAGGVGKLFGTAKVNYGITKLESGYIRMNIDSTELFATGKKDTAGVVTEDPIFTDVSGEYGAKTIRYNFKTGKGIITQVVTEQGEGYVISGMTKKIGNDLMCMVDGMYTTCENHEHPHFYLDLSKAKVRPGKYIVSGPAHLVMEDVHLPLFIPFGYFPFTKKYSSGFLTPSYGDELTRGFYLKDGGYYFAINDYMDMALTGELYSKGSWGVRARTAYKVKYKFSGSFNFSYLESVTSEKNLPDYAKSNNLSVTWSHSQDSKSNPFSSFSANVNFQTSGYSRNDLTSYYNPQEFANNTKSSSVNYNKRFPESPFSLNMSASITQRSKDSVLSVSLPELRISMSTISPFKRKNQIGDERWYEKIRVGYSGSFSNRINEVKEYDILKKSLIRDWKNGASHDIPISATFNLLNFINITPSLSYSEKWNTSSIKKHYNDSINAIIKDTIWGFNRIWEYSASVSASTKLYGLFQPNQKIFGEKINMIRHVITPSVSFSYRPDFGSKRYGYYDEFSYTNDEGNIITENYSRFENSMYGAPSSGKSGSIGFDVSNNLEMKIKQVTDTSVVYKKVSLIDNFSFASSYNMAADSLNWSDINANIRIKFGKYTLNLSGSFDPYTYQLNSSGSPYKVNITQFKKNGIPGKLTGTGTSFSYTLNNDTFKKKEKKEKKSKSDSSDGESNAGESEGNNLPEENNPNQSDEANSDEAGSVQEYDPEAKLYKKLKMPWSIVLNYSLRYSRADFNKEKLEYNYGITQNLNINGNLSLGENWKLNASTSYNFITKEFTTMNCSVSRDLHCWQMSASFIPIGRYKSYNFSIRVKAAMLQDLKYEQHQNPNDNNIWN